MERMDTVNGEVRGASAFCNAQTHHYANILQTRPHKNRALLSTGNSASFDVQLYLHGISFIASAGRPFENELRTTNK